jgi:hypothetical protein
VPLVPAFVVPPSRRVLETPARRLLVAVLEQAIVDFQHGQPEVRRWLASPRQDYCTSFAAICEVLGVDPGRVRVALARERTSAREGRPADALRAGARATRLLSTA